MQHCLSLATRIRTALPFVSTAAVQQRVKKDGVSGADRRQGTDDKL
jgi:hypothetical protein